MSFVPRCRRLGGAVLLSSSFLFGCGSGSSPVVPTSTPGGPAGAVQPTPTPTPVAAPTPTPVPTPTPEPTPPSYPNGQPIVHRVTAHIAQVIGVNGKTRLHSPREGEPIYVNEVIRFDVTAKDEFGNPTTGSGHLDPGWADDPDGVIDWNHDVGFNPRATAVAAGDTWVLASLDGVRSDAIKVSVRNR